jgi:hypothetical protein
MPTANIDGRTINSVARRIAELLVAEHQALYDLGKEIDRVFRDDLWMHWPESTFKNREAWCWNVLGFKERKATYLRSIYVELSTMEGLDEATHSAALRLGWTKLYHVLRVAKNAWELKTWIGRVENEKLSEAALRTEVQIALAPPQAPEGSEGAASDELSAVLSRSGSASTEQPAEEEQEEETEEVAEDAEARARALVADRRASGNRGRIQFPMTFMSDEDLRIFTRAIQVVRDRLNPEMGYGEAAGIIATSYLATLPREDEGGVAVELEQMIQAIERTYGVRLRVVGGADEDPETGEVVVSSREVVTSGRVVSSLQDEVEAAAADI